MSAEATATVLFADAPVPWLTFPPFPEPPPGVHIIPFKDFKPKGVVVKFDPDSTAAEEPEVETDAEGIPTVALRVKHELTDAEQSRKKRKKSAHLINVNGVVRRTIWYEEWEEGEQFRRTSPINTSMSRVDRLHQATQEFKSTRTWPPSASGLMNLWDAFRLYIGIISSMQPPASKQRFAKMPEPQDDEEDDTVDFIDKEVVVMDSEEARFKRRAEEEILTAERRQNLTEDAKSRIVKHHELKDARMDFFLNDPEMATMIFFTAHYRDRGLMWEKVRCRDGPILIQFFYEFILRSRVFPEYEKQFKKALEVVKKARKELPFTFVLGGVLPDAISERFVDLFGSMTNNAIWGPEDAENLARFEEERKKIETERKQREDEAKEEDKKRFEEFVASNAGDSTVQTIDPDDPSLELPGSMVQDPVMNNADQNGLEVEPTASGWADASTWDHSGTGGETWGSISDSPWGEAIGGNDAWAAAGAKKSLLELLGPTVLPHTHTTGIIEESTRKIIEVVRPPVLPGGEKMKKGSSAANAVEEELAQRFGYMVLAPWKKIGNHINSDISAPRFLPDSRGLVVDAQTNTSGELESTDSDVCIPGVAPHDPKKDLIHVLLTPEAVEQVVEGVGMGFAATWVQLVRRDDAAEAEDENAKGWKKVNVLDRNRRYGATGVNGMPTKWWYMEQHGATFASFHADRQYDEQD